MHDFQPGDRVCIKGALSVYDIAMRTQIFTVAKNAQETPPKYGEVVAVEGDMYLPVDHVLPLRESP